MDSSEYGVHYTYIDDVYGDEYIMYLIICILLFAKRKETKF